MSFPGIVFIVPCFCNEPTNYFPATGIIKHYYVAHLQSLSTDELKGNVSCSHSLKGFAMSIEGHECGTNEFPILWFVSTWIMQQCHLFMLDADMHSQLTNVICIKTQSIKCQGNHFLTTCVIFNISLTGNAEITPCASPLNRAIK